MSAGTPVKHVEVSTRGNLPSQLEIGTLYFIIDESRIIVNHGNVTTEYAGTANAVVDSLAGGETQKAPSVRSVAAALDGKADTLGGKILQSQLPATLTLYRGVFASQAALSAAFPTDVNGAFATVTATTSMWYFDGTAWTDTGTLGATAIHSVNGLMGTDVNLTYNDMAPANISQALAGNPALSSSNPVAAMNDLPAAATESVAGKIALATAAEVRAGLDATKAIIPARRPEIFSHLIASFNNFDANALGPQYCFILGENIATSGAPLYDLYGIGGAQAYAVNTIGQYYSNYSYLVQEATVLSPAAYVPRKFVRTSAANSMTPNWTKWAEVPTLTYHSGVRTIIVDGDNGDDSTADGTEAKPFQTLEAAKKAVPDVTLGWRTHIRIKAGTYVMPTADLDFGIHLGGRIYIESFSGAKDVEIVFSSATSGLKRGISLFGPNGFEIYRIKFLKDSAIKEDLACFVTGTPFVVIDDCEFQGFYNGLTIESSRGLITNCNYINCNQAVYCSKSSLITHQNSAASGTNYINSVNDGIIIKKGLQATGTIATDRIVAGQIIQPV
jgi:hypothetical protein